MIKYFFLQITRHARADDQSAALGGVIICAVIPTLFLQIPDPAERQHLDDRVLIDPVLAPLPSKAALLDSSERSRRVGDQSGIDPDHSHLSRGSVSQPASVRVRVLLTFQCLSHPPDATVIPRKEVGRKADVGVVREVDNFLLRLEREQRCHRPEGLLAVEPLREASESAHCGCGI